MAAVVGARAPQERSVEHGSGAGVISVMRAKIDLTVPTASATRTLPQTSSVPWFSGARNPSRSPAAPATKSTAATQRSSNEAEAAFASGELGGGVRYGCTLLV